jgi:hypothetical protein
VSRKYTFAIDSSSETPSANTASTSMNRMVTGRKGSGFPPKITTATTSTVISKLWVNSQASTFAMTNVSRGKYTLLIRLALLTSTVMPVVTVLAKNSHGSRPVVSHSAKMSRPEGCPLSGGVVRSSIEKTTE